MSESVPQSVDDLQKSELLQREASGNPELLQAIITREVRLDDFLQMDRDTKEAALALKLYKMNENRVSSIKQRYGIDDPQPRPIETEN